LEGYVTRSVWLCTFLIASFTPLPAQDQSPPKDAIAQQPASQQPVTQQPTSQDAAGQDPTADRAAGAAHAEDNRDAILFSSETERIGPLTKKLVRNIILDERAIFTSPFHTPKKDRIWWPVFLGATAAFVSVDESLSKDLPNTKDQVGFSKHVSELGATYTLLPIAAGFYGIGAIFDDPKARETGALGFEAVADGFITVAILKVIFSRERPDEGSDQGRFFHFGHDGFPSGHAVQAWAVASVIAHEYQHRKIGPIIAYGLAGLVSASRFSARKHYASDIIAGAGMGWFIGRYVFQTHVDHSIHKRPPSVLKSMARPAIMPMMDARTATYGLTLGWGH
jgi:hypothetical protein